MSTKRRGETQPPPARNSRVFENNGSWYLALRGGSAKGPYENRQEAVAELVQLKRQEAMFGQAIWH